jgi:hypothetical protein
MKLIRMHISWQAQTVLISHRTAVWRCQTQRCSESTRESSWRIFVRGVSCGMESNCLLAWIGVSNLKSGEGVLFTWREMILLVFRGVPCCYLHFKGRRLSWGGL